MLVLSFYGVCSIFCAATAYSVYIPFIHTHIHVRVHAHMHANSHMHTYTHAHIYVSVTRLLYGTGLVWKRLLLCIAKGYPHTRTHVRDPELGVLLRQHILVGDLGK